MHVSIIGKSEPVFVIIYSFLLLGSVPTTLALVGGVLIMGSSVWLALQEQETS
jgi:drug/metabolite transporter (DMT)-like permease